MCLYLVCASSYKQIPGLAGGPPDKHGEDASGGQGPAHQGCNRGGPLDDTRGTQRSR